MCFREHYIIISDQADIIIYRSLDIYNVGHINLDCQFNQLVPCVYRTDLSINLKSATEGVKIFSSSPREFKRIPRTSPISVWSLSLDTTIYRRGLQSPLNSRIEAIWSNGSFDGLISARDEFQKIFNIGHFVIQLIG